MICEKCAVHTTLCRSQNVPSPNGPTYNLVRSEQNAMKKLIENSNDCRPAYWLISWPVALAWLVLWPVA